MKLSPQVKSLVEEYKRGYQASLPQEGVSTIEVDEVAAKVASFYENIRGVVDWREEHLLRKTAIERILKRRLTYGSDHEDFAEHFMQELVRGGHFPNNSIPENRIEKVQRIVKKYMFLIASGEAHSKKFFGDNLENWLFSIAAAEVEEAIVYPYRERAIIEFMTEEFGGKLVVKTNGEDPLSDGEREVQLLVSVERALFKLDDPTITLHLLERFYNNWSKLGEKELTDLAENIDDLRERIYHTLHHPLSERFYKITEMQDTPYLLLFDILSSNPDAFDELISSPERFEEAIKEAYKARHMRLRGRIRRAAIYSTLSIFITKVLAALVIEFPIDRYFNQTMHLIPLIVSIGVPPLLMLLLVTLVKTSTDENLNKVLLQVIKITYENDKKDIQELVIPKKTKSAIRSIVSIVYMLSFLVTFGVMITVLWMLDFSIFSIIIFAMFISLVAFAGAKIRQRARELMIEEQKVHPLYAIIDLFSLPVLQVGKWLSGQIARYNILIIIFNLMIEAPFQIFVEFLEQWRAFLREQKDKIH